MSRYVIDASIAVMWLLPGLAADGVTEVMRGEHELHAPDLIFPEVANALRKRVRGGHLSLDGCLGALGRLGDLPVRIHPAAEDVAEAVRVSLALQQTVYDTVYLALARRLGCRLVTADRRFYRALVGNGLAGEALRVPHENE